MDRRRTVCVCLSSTRRRFVARGQYFGIPFLSNVHDPLRVTHWQIHMVAMACGTGTGRSLLGVAVRALGFVDKHKTTGMPSTRYFRRRWSGRAIQLVAILTVSQLRLNQVLLVIESSKRFGELGAIAIRLAPHELLVL